MLYDEEFNFQYIMYFTFGHDPGYMQFLQMIIL